MLTPEQEKRLAYLELAIGKMREEQRILYAVRDGAYITQEETTAQIAKADVISKEVLIEEVVDVKPK